MSEMCDMLGSLPEMPVTSRPPSLAEMSASTHQFTPVSSTEHRKLRRVRHKSESVSRDLTLGVPRDAEFSGCIKCTVCIMWLVATDDLVVCLFVMQLCSAKTAEKIKILFGMKTLVAPRHSIRWGWPSG